ncbi:MAG: MmcQ/YjbR family DNA-binding protein, partial [Erysipelotrichaceae bacterium]|nr:MmcQ/YjbR family DNA-binding protein [Erysipelotrichaceae bacterium]
IYGSVYDLLDEEVYYPVHAPRRHEAYVETVREAYRDVLRKIAASCCEDKTFIFDQTNRIASLIRERYGEGPDHPFKKRYSSCAVFRYPLNRKWYALVMDIERKVLKEKGHEKDDTVIEVMNLKVSPDKREDLLKVKGILPAYHMNKEGWISVILDGSTDDWKVMELVEESREYAVGKGGKLRGKEAVSWIVPANPEYYDVIGHFRNRKVVTWKQGGKIREGDIVYMYIAAPYSEIRYKCLVTKTDIPYSYRNDKVKMSHIMEMKVLKEYPSRFCDFKKLNKLGIRAIRGQRTATDEFIEYMEKKKGQGLCR